MMIKVSVVSQVTTPVGLVRSAPWQYMPMLMQATHSHRKKCDGNQQRHGGCAEAQSIEHKNKD